MKKLDVGRDGVISEDDFSKSVKERDVLLLESMGPVFPSRVARQTFLSTFTERLRRFWPVLYLLYSSRIIDSIGLCFVKTVAAYNKYVNKLLESYCRELFKLGNPKVQLDATEQANASNQTEKSSWTSDAPINFRGRRLSRLIGRRQLTRSFSLQTIANGPRWCRILIASGCIRDMISGRIWIDRLTSLRYRHKSYYYNQRE